MEFPEIATDGGERAIIYSTNAGGNQPIHGAWFADHINGWLITAWYKDGKRTHLKEPSALDIVRAINEGKIKVS